MNEQINIIENVKFTDGLLFLDRVWAWRAHRTSLAVGEQSSCAGCVLEGVFSTLLTILISSSIIDLAIRRVLA
jgi:hypothetical protein